MLEKHQRYYYEVQIKGKNGRKKVEVVTEVSSSQIKPSRFPYPHKKRNRLSEKKAVLKFLQANLPSGVTKIEDCAIGRKDEFDHSAFHGFAITRTTTTPISKWGSLPTLRLNRRQKRVFDFIGNQLPTIALKWSEWKRLFTIEENLKLLHSTAPTFFSLVRESMMHDVILSIQRLFDREVMGRARDETCSFSWLAKNIDLQNQKKEFELAFTKLKSDLASLRTWRNKVISHNDYKYSGKKSKLPPVQYDKVDDALRRMSALMNIIQMNLATNQNQCYFIYHDIVCKGGSTDLIHYLKRAVKDRQDALQRMRDRQKKWTDPDS